MDGRSRALGLPIFVISGHLRANTKVHRALILRASGEWEIFVGTRKKSTYSRLFVLVAGTGFEPVTFGL